MASLNKVIIIGNLARDPEVRYTQSGTAVASMSIVTNERTKTGGEWKEHAEFHNVTAWGNTAEICGAYLEKGKQCAIEGKLQTRKWQDKDGKDRYTTEIVAENVIFLGSKAAGSAPGKSSPVGSAPIDDDFSDIPF